MWAEHFTLIEALEHGDIARADAALANYAQGAVRLRHPMHRWQAAMWTAMRHLLAGRFNQAERSALAAHAAGQHAQDLNVRQTVAVQLAPLRGERGGTDKITPVRRVAVERAHAVPAGRPPWALPSAKSDDRDRARHAFESLASD